MDTQTCQAACWAAAGFACYWLQKQMASGDLEAPVKATDCWPGQQQAVLCTYGCVGVGVSLHAPKLLMEGFM
eukprot:1158356-Pelagomonas_calceolata.AAC.4